MRVIRKHASNPWQDPGGIHELVGLLYEAAVDGRVWPVFLLKLARFTNPSFASFVTREFGVGSAARGLILLRRVPEENSGFEALYTVLSKHLRRALELQRRMRDLEAHQANLHASLDRFLMGVALLDERLLVRFVNTSARRILDQRNGVFLSHGMLSAMDRKEALHLNSVLHQMVTGKETSPRSQQGTFLWISRAAGRKPIGLVIHRAKRCTGIADVPCSVAVYLSDPEQGILPSREALVQLYGFTPAESAMACQLLQGRNLEETTRHLNVSVNTAKTHLKRILQKTDTSRQSDLIRLLLSGPASLGI